MPSGTHRHLETSPPPTRDHGRPTSHRRAHFTRKRVVWEGATRLSVCLPACLPHRLVAGQACVLRRRIRFPCHLDRRLTDTLLPFFYCSEPPSPVWAALGCWATGYWVAGLLGSWDLGRPSFLPPHIHIPPPPLGSSPQAVHSVTLSSPFFPAILALPALPAHPCIHPSIHPSVHPPTRRVLHLGCSGVVVVGARASRCWCGQASPHPPPRGFCLCQ